MRLCVRGAKGDVGIGFFFWRVVVKGELAAQRVKA